MKFTRILSIDGGGIRGIIPAQILVTLERYLKLNSHNPDACIADYFDLIAGTSTGGILTILYLFPSLNNPQKSLYTAQDVLNFYTEHGTSIFHKNFWYTLRSLNGLISNKYSATVLEELFLSYLKDTQLSDLLKPCLIPAYDIRSQSTLFFNQLDPFKTHKENFFVRDVVRATSAAPIYFPIAHITSDHGTPYHLIDGGLFANNPTLCAYVEATKLPCHPSCKNMLILSLGTGSCCTQSWNIPFLNNGGLSQWALPLFDILMTSSSEVVSCQINSMFDIIGLSSQYLRIQPCLPDMGYPCLKMDDAKPSDIALLQEIGARTAELYGKQLDRLSKLLIDNN